MGPRFWVTNLESTIANCLGTKEAEVPAGRSSEICNYDIHAGPVTLKKPVKSICLATQSSSLIASGTS